MTLVHALFDVLLALVLAWWIDRRFAERLTLMRFVIESPPAEAPALEEPPGPPAMCDQKRQGIQCVLELGHRGNHEGRTGVAWL